MSRVTARQIARMLSVHPSTVSRVLAGTSPTHRYDQRTVRRIRETARRLGYRPALAARALRTGRTGLVGLLVSDIASPFFAELAARIERCARAGQYQLLLCNNGDSPAQQRENLLRLLAVGVDGMIVAPSGGEGLDQVLAAGVPLVTIDRPARAIAAPHVGLDDRRAGEVLGRHLRHLRYRAVGVVAPPARNDPGIARRLAGLRLGLGDSAAVPWIEQCILTESRQSATVDLARRLSGARNPVQAIVGLNLLATLAAIRELERMAIDVPERIGLAGIDDFAAAPLLNPPLTVVAQPLERIAAAAIDLLVPWMNDPKRRPAPAPHLLPPDLTIRRSLRTMPPLPSRPHGSNHSEKESCHEIRSHDPTR